MATSEEERLQEMLKETDAMYYGGKSPEAIQILRKYSQSENTEVLWRLVRACYTVGKFFTKDKTESKQLSDEATGYAKRAVAIDEHNFNTQKVSDVLYSTPYFLPPPPPPPPPPSFFTRISHAFSIYFTKLVSFSVDGNCTELV